MVLLREKKPRGAATTSAPSMEGPPPWTDANDLPPLRGSGKQAHWVGHRFCMGEGGGLPSAVAMPAPQHAVPLAAAPGAVCHAQMACCAGMGGHSLRDVPGSAAHFCPPAQRMMPHAAATAVEVPTPAAVPAASALMSGGAACMRSNTAAMPAQYGTAAEAVAAEHQAQQDHVMHAVPTAPSFPLPPAAQQRRFAPGVEWAPAAFGGVPLAAGAAAAAEAVAAEHQAQQDHVLHAVPTAPSFPLPPAAQQRRFAPGVEWAPAAFGGVPLAAGAAAGATVDAAVDAARNVNVPMPEIAAEDTRPAPPTAAMASGRAPAKGKRRTNSQLATEARVKVLREPIAVQPECKLGLVPDGFPLGPIEGDLKNLQEQVNLFTSNPRTGSGAFGVTRTRAAATCRTKGDNVWLQCVCQSTGCQWRTKWEESTLGWLLVDYKVHTGARTDATGQALANEPPVPTENGHNHALLLDEAQVCAKSCSMCKILQHAVIIL